MTLQDAIKSGKRFRRPSWDVETAWYYYDDSKRLCFYDSEGKNFVNNGPLNKWDDDLSYDDILANDWVIDEKKIEISRRELKSAIEKITSPYVSICQHSLIKDLTKQLGLDE